MLLCHIASPYTKMMQCLICQLGIPCWLQLKRRWIWVHHHHISRFLCQYQGASKHCDNLSWLLCKGILSHWNRDRLSSNLWHHLALRLCGNIHSLLEHPLEQPAPVSAKSHRQPAPREYSFRIPFTESLWFYRCKVSWWSDNFAWLLSRYRSIWECF